MSDAGDLSILGLSLEVAITATFAMLPLGIALAWFLAGWRGQGRVLVEAILTLPLVLPPTAIGILLPHRLSKNNAFGRVVRPFDLKSFHLEGGRSGFVRHVAPSARTLRAHRIRGDRSAAPRCRSDVGRWPVARIPARGAPLGLARNRRGSALGVLSRARRIWRDHSHRRQHPGAHPDARARHFSSVAGGTRCGRPAPRRSRLFRRPAAVRATPGPAP
jgi:hypothetical protein